MSEKLDYKQKHLLRLISKDGGPDGWAEVSDAVFSLMGYLPLELVEFQPYLNGGGRARLTDAGANIVAAMEWL